MSQNLTRKILAEHLVDGEMTPGAEIAIRVDQTLTQDATGTMACLQFEAIGIPRVRTQLSVSYVDHNTLQMGFRNPDDHRYLRTVAQKYGMVFSPPGTGICHQLHLENFGKPGATLLGSDSHTPTAGGVGSLAMGAGGLSVALAMAGEPYSLPMPRVVKVWLENELTGWTQAKDIILHLLGLLTVKGGVGKVFEFAGPGVASLTVPERSTITNMGAELGATCSIFPSDEQTQRFLKSMGRPVDFKPLAADEGADYDEEIIIDLAKLEPLAATPHMPDKVTPVAELDGLAVEQVAIGSCTNSSYSDLAMVAHILAGKLIAESTDLLIAPGSKQVLKMLAAEGSLEQLLDAGARLLECACGPCIGQGGSPNSDSVTVRTFNRNFEGRSGTQDAKVYLVSPVTAAFVALKGRFTAPSTWAPTVPKFELPKSAPSIGHLFIFPAEDGENVEILRGPNIAPLGEFAPLPDRLSAPVVLKTGDDITTDHILPAGPAIISLRSNVPAISKHVFEALDPGFVGRIEAAGQGVIVAGENYGQGSSREHAALAPRHLGVKAVLVKSFARIHRANLINFGILPLLFADKADYDRIEQGRTFSLNTTDIAPGAPIKVEIEGLGEIELKHDLTSKELAIIQAGGLLNFARQNQAA